MIFWNYLVVIALLAGCAARPSPPAPERLSSSAAEIALRRARAFADPAQQRTFGLAHVAAAEIVLDTAPDSRRRAADVLGVDLTAAGGLALVRLGRAGYLVYTPGGLGTAGELGCEYALLDPKFAVSRFLCG